MKGLLGFVRTTIVGGLLYLIPITLLILVLGKALSIAHRFAPAFADVVEELQLAHVFTPRIVAVLLLVLFCFLAGLFSRTALARRIGDFLDTKILINVPGYALLRSMGGNSALESFAKRPVMVTIEDEAWQIAFVVDKVSDERIAVYVPGVPQVGSGSLYYLAPDRVKPLDISPAAAFQILRRMGVRSGDIVRENAAVR